MSNENGLLGRPGGSVTVRMINEIISIVPFLFLEYNDTSNSK
jgi:hypothetical protein